VNTLHSCTFAGFVLSLALPGAIAAYPQVPTFIFATHAGGTNSSIGQGLAADGTGGTFVTGGFIGPAIFGTNDLTGYGKEDIFVAKYDATGAILWVAQAGGTNGDGSRGIAVDGAGNCYVTGGFSGMASFGSTNLVGSMAPASSDIFVAKYGGSGNLLWVRQAGGDGGNGGSEIAVDTNGNSYVTGAYIGTATFGNVTLTSSGSSPNHNIFLAKYDTDGNVLWAKQDGGIWDDQGEAVALDGRGNVYVTGFYGIALNQPGMYLAKCYDSAGRGLWTVRAAPFGKSDGYGIAADASDNLFVTGDLWGTVSFVGTTAGSNQVVTLTSQGIEDAFLAKFTSDGNVLWARQLGGTNGYAAGLGVATDTAGSCFVCGEFTGILTTSLTNLVAVGPQDGFIAKYDTAGNLIWILQVGGSGYDAPIGVATSTGRGVYVTGFFSAGTRFGNIPLNSYGSYDVFLARIDEVPLLSVTNTAKNVQISWPTNQVGFALETATNLVAPVDWSTNTNPVQVSGDHYVVTDELKGSAAFYRLSKP
jgi:hypothetical protein